MKVLLIGSGGREHALAWKLTKSRRLSKLYAAPGSAAIRSLAEQAPCSAEDFRSVVGFCASRGIDLVAVGPEAPLAAGLADALRHEGVLVFGPGQAAARLESSKSFAKDFMRRHGIPSAASKTFSDLESARASCHEFGFPVAVKADGLAAGKGVRICRDRGEALAALDAFMKDGLLGESGRTVVVEEFLTGQEMTLMGFCDGETFLSLPPCSDHKRLLDGDLGPNTGGMGVVAPTPGVGTDLLERIRGSVVDRTLAGLRADRLSYCGILYCGLMLTPAGPRVLEFNVRFGDPETQAVLPLMDGDLLELMEAAGRGTLSRHSAPWRGAGVCVVLASEGYPENPRTGRPISGLDAAAGPDSLVFHAGTSLEDGTWNTRGGRVLGVTGLGQTLEEARGRAYAAASRIRFEGMQYRSDIGAKTRLETTA